MKKGGDSRKGKIQETLSYKAVYWRTHSLCETTADPVIARTPWSHAQNSNGTPGHATTLQAN